MISDIILGNFYQSANGHPFIVDCVGKHGQDCSLPMVVYRNVEPTADAPANTVWVISESLFMQRFSEFEEGVYHEFNVRREEAERTFVDTFLRPHRIPVLAVSNPYDRTIVRF